MSKVLKFFIVVMLLMSIAVLTLSSMLFGNREMLKGRILEHEKYSTQIASALEVENFNTASLKNLDSMGGTLSTLVGQSQNKVLELKDTQADLETRTEELAVTTENLNISRTELAQSKNRVTNLENTVTQKDGEIRGKENQIANLEQEKNVLEGEQADFERKLVEADETIEDFRAEVATLEKVLNDLEGELTGNKSTFEAEDGTVGRLLAVNDAWNFVVVDLGNKAGLGVGAELLVHRNDELIGKVRISNAEEDMAVADIVEEWQTAPFSVGDDVIYVTF